MNSKIQKIRHQTSQTTTQSPESLKPQTTNPLHPGNRLKKRSKLNAPEQKPWKRS